MGFKCGIVGLPNVGKSTLFNALTSTAAAEAANYPFCTIEPNIGRVGVPDSRLEELAKIAGSAEIIPTQIEFVDIAGLVKGASKGEGLGNQFLANIREVDAIIYVVRCFEDGDVTHVEGSVDPIRDAEIVETELILADLESLEKRIPNVEKKVKGGVKGFAEELALMKAVMEVLAEGRPARVQADSPEREAELKTLHLLTSKPVLYVCNVEEGDVVEGNALSDSVKARAESEHTSAILVCAKIEEEIAALDNDEEKREFLETLGLKETGLAKLIRAGYALLDLTTFFTVGPKEARAWTVRRNAHAPQAAGVIHTDFEKGFIKAEVIACEDFMACKGEQGAKEAGKLRLEGKEYTVRDGDVMHFRFNN